MTVTNYITQYVAVVLPFIVSVIALYIAIRYDKNRVFVDFFDEKIVSSYLAKSVYLAAHATDHIFGIRILSYRCFLISILISMISFAIFFIFAMVTTPSIEIGQFYPFDVSSYINSIKSRCAQEYCDEIIDLNSFIFTHYAVLLFSIINNFVIDFVSTIETRFLIRRVKINDYSMVVAGVILADIALSLIIFIIFFAILFAINGFIISNVISVIYQNSIIKFESILSQIVEGINISTWVILNLTQSFFNDYVSIGLYINLCYPEGVACKPGLVATLPMTTFVTTSFATSLWIYFYALSLLIVRFLARSFVFCRKIVISVYDQPGRLVFWSCAASVVYLLYPLFLLS